ncbi:DegT/DnrJ/EryC1/StrS family aminotransferase [Pseudobutyrivibrio ruminis]|uniref:dTDP-4-amino-4,6-dideoxygalactose transaminase n=1 Tax=Pseudobutyrivibrio ruminis DSM 9787 TaxID=1123011 RepID=A0A285S8L0_9FIRM|nr:DegT/DnrJ/EryC1/StrS family aminotransferase [Pseudobutyrivibrio ruminis]SOC03922.1 dTDP-4-amino-4,6-dideoxygalactose transaminase [Pseudobutyrivibrio ruminis DSM 9787]
MSENEIILRNIPFSPPDISDAEVEEVAKALKSGWITTGPRTKLLERRLAAYIDTGKNDVDCESEAGVAKYSNRVVCLNSATAAEELNLRIWGVGPGDEVIVPAYTYTASASAVCHCGATPVFVDVQPNGNSTSHMPEYDYEALEAAITEKTKAIVVVDLGGLVGDYERVFEIAERQKSKFVPKSTTENSLDELSSKIQQGFGRVAIVADCAHSLGASVSFKGQKIYAGNLADFSSFSFHAVKNFTTAEGGASSWKLPKSVYDTGVTDAEIYHMYQLLSLHGQSKDALAKTQIGAWEYDIVGPWYKCNMTDIMAAIGLRQLDRYLGLLDRRLDIIRKYDNACDELGLLHLNHHMDEMDSSNHLYLMRVPNATEQQRNEFIIKLAERGVATNVHYKPLPMMTAYKKMGYDINDFPNAYDYYRNEITLPLHTNLSDEDVDYIIASLKAVFAK